MGQERLNALSMLYSHTDIDIRLEEIVEQLPNATLDACYCLIDLITIIKPNNSNMNIINMQISCGGYLCRPL